MDTTSECVESSTITFEWTVKGLKSLFDSTHGDKKSKVTKSALFGNNRWQILFYPNSGQVKEGTENGGFVSLYLSCEPTPEEKEAALSSSGKWVREGIYKFRFELRNIGKVGALFNSKEAHNHTFTYKTFNWGWAQYARREDVFYQSLSVKTNDAFVIICTITSAPTAPRPATVPRLHVPRALLETVGSLLDDPVYSDVQFVIPKRGQALSNGWKIWASKKLLQRADYFQTMFNSNFAEGSKTLNDSNETPRIISRDLRKSPPQLNLLLDEFDDSDNEFDDEEVAANDRDITADPMESSILLANSQLTDWDKVENDGTNESHISSPHIQHIPLSHNNQTSDSTKSSNKMTIVVKDAAYTTYRAMLYYLYTDSIIFAPLSSSFTGVSSDGTNATPADSLPSTPSEGSQVPLSKHVAPLETMFSRADWNREWVKQNPGRPAPCSAKSIYRIADRLDLPELKDRAEEHITKSLTVENIAYEVFSPFAAAFEAIRKVEIDFFLNHWKEIRASDTMRHIWVQIRNGRHPGFEEVWPVIVQSLEVRPHSPIGVSSPSTHGTEQMS